MKNSIIHAFKESNSYIGIIVIVNIEYLHKGTRGEKILIDFKIVQSIHGSIKATQMSSYYNYPLNGTPPFIIGKKYLVVFKSLIDSNTHIWPVSFQN